MIALVTGSNGFVGSHLVEALLARGYEVDCLVRRTSNLRWLKGLPVRLVYGDVASEESLREAVAGKDYVYHVAGVVKGTSQRAFDGVNVRGTANLLRACWKWNAGLKRFVLVSSLSAAGPSRKGMPLAEHDTPSPVSRYGRSKLKAEEEARKYMGRFPVTIIRPPVIFGPRDWEMYPFFKMLKRGVVVLVAGERHLSFVYVRDAVGGMILAGESEAGISQTYYIAWKRGYSWREFVEAAGRAMGTRPLVLSVPSVAARVVGGFNSLVGTLTGRARMLDWQKVREMLQPYWLCDISKAERELKYRPAHSLEKALAETIEWYKKHGWI